MIKYNKGYVKICIGKLLENLFVKYKLEFNELKFYKILELENERINHSIGFRFESNEYFVISTHNSGLLSPLLSISDSSDNATKLQ